MRFPTEEEEALVSAGEFGGRGTGKEKNVFSSHLICPTALPKSPFTLVSLLRLPVALILMNQSVLPIKRACWNKPIISSE
jgi:predicted LPLAT superfamily acyltransferase